MLDLPLEQHQKDKVFLHHMDQVQYLCYSRATLMEDDITTIIIVTKVCSSSMIVSMVTTNLKPIITQNNRQNIYGDRSPTKEPTNASITSSTLRTIM